MTDTAPHADQQFADRVRHALNTAVSLPSCPPITEHGRHRYELGCALCHGDLLVLTAAVLAVVQPEHDRLRAELAEARATNTLRAQLLIEKQEEIYRLRGLRASDAPMTGPSPAADPDEWVRCSGLHCTNSDRFTGAAERGWEHGHMDTWLCPTCRPAAGPTT